MRQLTGLLTLVVLLVVAPIQAQEAPHLSVVLQGSRLSVNAQATPLRKILLEISRLSGIRIFLASGLEAEVVEERRTVAFEALRIEEALRRLLVGQDFSLVYSSTELAEVRVYVGGRREFRELRMETKQPPHPFQAEPRAARSPESGQDELARLRGDALGNAYPVGRSRALEELAEVGDPRSALETALQVLEVEGDGEVVQSVLDLLGGHLHSAPIEPILRIVTSDRELAVRIRALELLSGRVQREPQVREVLRTLARIDQNEKIREAAEALLRDLEPDAPEEARHVGSERTERAAGSGDQPSGRTEK